MVNKNVLIIFCDIKVNKMVITNWGRAIENNSRDIQKFKEFLEEACVDNVAYNTAKMDAVYVVNYIDGAKGINIPLHVLKDRADIIKGKDRVNYPYANDGSIIRKLVSAAKTFDEKGLYPSISPMFDLTDDLFNCLEVLHKMNGSASNGSQRSSYYDWQEPTNAFFVINDGQKIISTDFLDVYDTKMFYNTNIRLDIPVRQLIGDLSAGSMKSNSGEVLFNGYVLNSILKKQDKDLMSDDDFNRLNEIMNKSNRFMYFDAYKFFNDNVIITDENKIMLAKKIVNYRNFFANVLRIPFFIDINKALDTNFFNASSFDKYLNKPLNYIFANHYKDKKATIGIVNEILTDLKEASRIIAKYVRGINVNKYNNVQISKQEEDEMKAQPKEPEGLDESKLSQAELDALNRFRNRNKR